MIDPLRPYWPTNRSLAGLLSRSLFLLVAAGFVTFSSSRSLAVLVAFVCAAGQASVLVLEWMELRKAGRPGLAAVAVVGFLFLALVAALIAESRWVLVTSVR